MTEPDLSRADWHKSSHSSQDGNCVEVALNLPGIVAVRDSKDPHGAVLAVDRDAWRTFLRARPSAVLWLSPIRTARTSPLGLAQAATDGKANEIA